MTVIEFNKESYQLGGYQSKSPAVEIATDDTNLIDFVIAYLQNKIEDNVLDKDWESVIQTAKQLMDAKASFDKLREINGGALHG